jgi:hypothetical protein
MNPILVIALLPLGATAPSSFQMTGLASMEACEYARAAITRQHEPFKKKIVLWSVCVPNGPPMATDKQ